MNQHIKFAFFILAGLAGSIGCIASDPLESVLFTKAITLFWIWFAIVEAYMLIYSDKGGE